MVWEENIWKTNVVSSESFFHFSRNCLFGSKQLDHMKGTLDRHLGGDLNSGALSDAVIIVKDKTRHGIWQRHSIRSSYLLFRFTVNYCPTVSCWGVTIFESLSCKPKPGEIHFFSESLARSDHSSVSKMLFNSTPGLTSSPSKLRGNSCASFWTDREPHVPLQSAASVLLRYSPATFSICD